MPQFEREPPISYYGTYFDNIVTGSMLPDGYRVYMGSKVSGSLLFKSAKTYSEAIDLNSTKNPGSFSRNVRFFSNEVIYSSIVPNPFEIYELNGGKYVSSSIDGTFSSVLSTRNILKMYFGTYNATLTSSVGNSQVSDNKFLGNHPFSKDYENIRRFFSDELSQKNFISYIEESGLSTDDIVFTAYNNFVTSSNLFHVGFALSGSAGINHKTLTETEGYINATNNFTTVTQGAEIRKGQMFKFLFGSKPFFLAEATVPTPTRFYMFGLGIKGWKYGLHSAFKTNTSAVYRSNRFGQFRDMLEQRIYTKVYVPGSNTTKIPLTINFVSGTDAAITASNPTKLSDSGIFDKEYRCGAPWVE